MAKITYVDKETLNDKPLVEPKYKLRAEDANEIKTSVNALYDNKADLASPIFTGTPTLPADTTIGDVSGTEIGYLNNLTTNIQDKFNTLDGIDTDFLNQLFSGWNTLTGATLTYSSSDTPNYTVATDIDLTTILSLGMKIKLTQTTTKYFILVGITSTTMTLYGGTDYTLVSAAITNVHFSTQKTPYGFPLSPDKWSVIIKDTVGLIQSNPTVNIWYNIGAFKIDVPIGCWNIIYDLIAEGAINSGTQAQCQTTLSTTNNSQTDIDFTSFARVSSGNASISISEKQYKSKIIEITTKTPYYLLAMTAVTGQSSVGFKSTIGTTTLKAVCAYL